MKRSVDKATHDYDAFLEDTPRAFYVSYGIGSSLTIALTLILWVAHVNPIAASVAGFVAVIALAVSLVCRYSRV